MKRRTIILIFAGLFFVWILADSLGIFDSRPYSEVPHGNHTHFLPKDCDPPLPVSSAPQRAPLPGERIDCQGQFVPDN